MPDPARIAPPPARSTLLGPLQAPPGSPEDPGSAAGSPLLDALGQLDTLRGAGDVPATPTPSELASDLVSAYQKGGRAAVRAYLGAHPEAVPALARAYPDELDVALEDALRRTPTGVRSLLPVGIRRDAIVDAVRSFLESALRSRILTQGQSLARALGRQLDTLGSALPSRLEALRSADPQSPLGQLASTLGVRGDAEDLARARASLDSQQQRVDAFLRYLASPNLWDPRELPVAAQNAARTLGFAQAPPGSLGGALLAPPEQASATTDLARRAYLRAMEEAVMLVGVGAHIANPLVLATSLVLARFDTLNAARHEGFVAYGRALGL